MRGGPAVWSELQMASKIAGSCSKETGTGSPRTAFTAATGRRRLEQSTQQAGRLRRGIAAHWWHLALSAQANTAHLPLSCSPLRGLSPRPYAYGAHALPAELRRHPRPCKERLMSRRRFWATQGRTCAWRPCCLVRAADGQQDRWQLQQRNWHGQPQDRIYLGHWAEGGWNRARNRLGGLGVVLLPTGGT